jgi:indole-3-glycerol phosphate synthase
MSTILDDIIAHKKKEVAERQELYPVRLLERSIYFPSPTVSLSGYLGRADKIGIIAEIKRRSPSKGVINANISVEKLSVGYMQAGASALSVLTDSKFFGGSTDDLREARKFNFCPILRKDFIVDEYQIVEAKSCGADAILLIAAALAPSKARELARVARDLGLETLLEVHSLEELSSHICDEVAAVGVNSRDLKTFAMNSALFDHIIGAIPSSKKAVAESGLSDAESVMRLKKLGFHGFLIGEAFMRHPRPEAACARLVEQIERGF